MYKEDLHGVAELMTLQSLKELLDKVRDWNMDDVSRKVCLIKRPKKDIVGPEFCVQPITVTCKQIGCYDRQHPI